MKSLSTVLDRYITRHDDILYVHLPDGVGLIVFSSFI